MAGATKSVTFNATPEKCFAVISDYEKYGEFLPEVRSVKVLEKKPGEVKVAYDVDLGIKRVKYTLIHREEAPKRMVWSFVEGEVMRDNKGSWVLEDAGGGQTRATYNVEVALGPLVPKAIINALVDTSLPKMLEAYKKRIESRG
jgi:coenzyme Q-binding protein COQ10